MTDRKPCCGRKTLRANLDEHGLGQSFRFAGRGLRFAFSERNLRLHLLAALLMLAAGAWLRILAWQWGVLILTIVLVIVAELVNTALECVVDLASPGYAELAAMAKDVAAGAVLFTALAALALANLIFAPALALPLQRGRDLIAGWPAAVSLPLLLVALFAGGFERSLLDRRQRLFLYAAAALAAAGARIFSIWPQLSVILLFALLLFWIFVAGHGQRISRYALTVVAWVLFWIWLWQRGM